MYASIYQSDAYLLLTNNRYLVCRVLGKTSCNDTVYDKGLQDTHRAFHPSTASLLHTPVDLRSSDTKLFAHPIAELVEDHHVIM